MKYYMDLEFIESGPENPIHFVSIGIISEEGDQYYAVSNEYDESLADDWVKENVLSKLDIEESKRKSNGQIAQEIVKFIGDDPKPIFVTYYGAYDHVVFCQLFGRMVDLPDNFPMFTYDIKQMAYDLGDPEIPQQKSGEHNALEDAKWNMKAHQFLIKKKFQGKRIFNLKEFKKLMDKR